MVSQIPSQGPAGLEKSKSPKVSGLGSWIQIPGLLEIWRMPDMFLYGGRWKLLSCFDQSEYSHE